MAEDGARRDESERFHRQECVSSRQAMWENASLETNTVMNWLGYGLEIRMARGDACRELGRLITALFRGDATWIIAGSKAEGLTCYLESDIDEIIVINSVICLEDGVNASTFPREITVFRSYTRMSYPGHCRLLLERCGSRIYSNIYDALCDDGYGNKLLSSDLLVNNWPKDKYGANMVQHDRAGPSIPTTVRGALHSDLVHALRYYCPGILSKWAERPRHWPPPKAVRQVVSLGAFLMPVGFKGSDYQHVEWRVCFNAGEIELLNNLNDTQIKLYVLLKMVKKDVLNPRKKEVTSYMLKNIVLWIAENNPQSSFHKSSLLHWLREGLDALRVSLVTRELPYYMIPDRNLMAACGLKEEQQRIWISTITEIINEGPRIILRLPKIRRALIAHPEPFRWYSRRKIELELLERMAMNLRMDENSADAILQTLHRRIKTIVFEVHVRMRMEGSRVNNSQDVYNWMLM